MESGDESEGGGGAQQSEQNPKVNDDAQASRSLGGKTRWRSGTKAASSGRM